jgi:hypothetical protein
MRYTVIPFKQSKFNFGVHLQRLMYGNQLSKGKLDNLHAMLKEQYIELFEVGKDSSTVLHERFYKRYRGGWPEFETLYELFIREIVAPMFDEDFLYQKSVTMRFHLPNNVAVGDFHTDAEFHHPAGEINFIIPLTDSDGTATVWVESEPGLNDFAPVPMRIGQLIRFDGNVLRHGNKPNKSGKTRCSMDFRILPISKYNPDTAASSITQKTKFVEGSYYKRFTK